jgi:hypothetical protein
MRKDSAFRLTDDQKSELVDWLYVLNTLSRISYLLDFQMSNTLRTRLTHYLPSPGGHAPTVLNERSSDRVDCVPLKRHFV